MVRVTTPFPAGLLAVRNQPTRFQGDPSRGSWPWAVLASAWLMLAVACAGGVEGGAKQGTSPQTTPSGVEPAGPRVLLYPLPARLVTACERARRRVPILCPSTFPRRTVGPPIPVVSQQLDFGSGLYGLELGYSAPYEGAPRKNRPDRFLHFVVLVRTGRARYPLEGPESLGPRRLGDRQGILYYESLSSVHYQHYVFVWREGGVEYQASLHSWDDEDAAIELLEALVSSLVPPDELPQSAGD
jgi:hypothetical protein